MTVPVLRQAVEEFRNNNTMELWELVNWGFVVEYLTDDWSSCSACESSGGLCWTNTTSSPVHTCLCCNGIHPLVCTNSDTVLKVLIGIGGALTVVLFGCFLICCIRKSSTRSLPFWKKDIDRNVEDFIRQNGFSTPKRYKYSDVKKITNSFTDKLGRSVYKGRLADGHLVAVKILNSTKGNGDKFINEVASIGRTSHVNVVSLFGFCYEGKKRALIYMCNGSLDKFVCNGAQHLGGEKLYEIVLGIARELEYLHRGCNTRILHFDIKPHNIFLDKDFCPKNANFGLAKMSMGKIVLYRWRKLEGQLGI